MLIYINMEGGKKNMIEIGIVEGILGVTAGMSFCPFQKF